MQLFPAIDLKDGRCVRLEQGCKDKVTVFSEDPVAIARQWIEMGVTWLHIVDLDGAFDGQPRNKSLIEAICALPGAPKLQLGGGIRDIETAQAYLNAGVTRLIIGTMALAEPVQFKALCRECPGAIGVSLDAVSGQLKTKGWVEDAGLTVTDVLPRLEADGAAFLIYTDISRDGMHSGVNYAAMEALVEATSLPVLAAGGVSTMKDLQALAPLASKGLEGVITGRAIYEGTLDVAEALAWLHNLG